MTTCINCLSKSDFTEVGPRTPELNLDCHLNVKDTLTYNGNDVSYVSLLFSSCFFILACTEYLHQNFDEFEFRHI